ncbi:DUF3429 domain-containing protein [Hydrogenovibrio halophilus]|uniref:DUF3429 domain-containing protein n=1 Tax=Hydrogenovibrio halophilus TaxID=373391 RepID=UPI00037C09E6|nr:DUF3429 domain-containing protein [Hydrogenovibrio halophilus]
MSAPMTLAHNRWLKPLGYAGLTPFIGLSLMLWLQPAFLNTTLLAQALLSYSALIFSFLSGLLWFGSLVIGLHDQRQASQTLWISVVAMLWSWSWFWWAMLAPGLVFLAAGLSYLLLWVYEREILAHWYPQGFFALRSRLSLVAAFSLWLAAMAVHFGGAL